MNIEIKNRFNGNIIIVGEYENIKDVNIAWDYKINLKPAKLCYKIFIPL